MPANLLGEAPYLVHSKNILTDGQRLYFADFGLAVSPRFELSNDEVDFVEINSAF